MENLNRNVKTLNIGQKLIDKLNQNNITNIIELCNLSRMELSVLGLRNAEINEIMIALQLLGLNLKPNHAKKNSLIDK